MTTAALALLLGWPVQPGRRVLLVECDPDGGAVLAGALQGQVEADRGLHRLAVADRRGRLAESLGEQLVDLGPEGGPERLLLPGLTDPAQAAALAYTWEPLARVCRELADGDCDVIVDLGRGGAFGPPRCWPAGRTWCWPSPAARCAASAPPAPARRRCAPTWTPGGPARTRWACCWSRRARTRRRRSPGR
ncbi:MinD/ParA family protein [Streptacidiphilus monticola]